MTLGAPTTFPPSRFWYSWFWVGLIQLNFFKLSHEILMCDKGWELQASSWIGVVDIIGEAASSSHKVMLFLPPGELCQLTLIRFPSARTVSVNRWYSTYSLRETLKILPLLRMMVMLLLMVVGKMETIIDLLVLLPIQVNWRMKLYNFHDHFYIGSAGNLRMGKR